MIRSLQRKYPGTNFHVATGQRSFYQSISRALVEAIEERRQAKEPEQLIHVGIICGPMVLRTAHHIEGSGIVSPTEQHGDVRFVAMNRAGESDCFQFSANYLTTLLSTTFPESKPVACTFNAHDKAAIDAARSNIDVLLCSAGPYPSLHAEQGYLERWCRKAVPQIGPAEKLPGNCIGDFCLIPIDAEGRRISTGNLVKTYYDTIQPYPQFEKLADLRGRTKILLPIDIRGKSKDAALTGKERIAKTLLQSGVVNVCILEKQLAKNLSIALGDYLITSASRTELDKPLRLCRALHFANPSDPRNFYILDPQSRIDSICDTNGDDRPEPLRLSIIPQIIISESQKELEHYAPEDPSWPFKIRIDGSDYLFQVNKGVRKPGHFSLVTLQLVRSHVDRLAAAKKARVWDLGCGTGFVGILTAKLLKDRVEHVLCSDIRSEAVKCAEFNREKLEAEGSVLTGVGDLFNVTEAANPFDVIAFNAPFLPDGLPDQVSVDSGGRKGNEVALQFCKGVNGHLRDGGWAILAVADFVDGGELRQELDRQFGQENVHVQDRLILYPCKTIGNIPLAYEVEWKHEIERRSDYRFETCQLGREEFVAFNMRHYCARKNA